MYKICVNYDFSISINSGTRWRKQVMLLPRSCRVKQCCYTVNLYVYTYVVTCKVNIIFYLLLEQNNMNNPELNIDLIWFTETLFEQETYADATVFIMKYLFSLYRISRAVCSMQCFLLLRWLGACSISARTPGRPSPPSPSPPSTRAPTRPTPGRAHSPPGSVAATDHCSSFYALICCSVLQCIGSGAFCPDPEWLFSWVRVRICKKNRILIRIYEKNPQNCKYCTSKKFLQYI